MTDAYYSKELDRIAADGNLRRLMPLEHTGCEVVVDGRNLLNLSSNDYLGLGADRELRAEFIAALRPEDFSMTSSSSRLLSGDFPVCEEVESMLAGMFGKEAALAFNSGYHMNLGILPAVAGKDTLIVADKLVHASIIDGIRLSGYDFYRFRHNDMDRVENILRQSSGKYRQVIIVVESVYSMDGDKADLKRICSLKRSYDNVAVYVDEAHAFGVMGETGLGLVEEQGCIGDIDWICGTFGKALGSVGGFVVCSRAMREFLVNRMRPLIFSTALPPLNMKWTGFLLERLRGMAPLRRHLAGLSGQLRTAGSGLSYISLDSLEKVLSVDFTVIHRLETFSVLSFPSPEKVLRHLKQTGVISFLIYERQCIFRKRNRYRHREKLCYGVYCRNVE